MEIMALIELFATLASRAMREIPAVMDALKAGDESAEEQLRQWLANQDDLRQEAQRTADIVQAAKARLAQQ